MVLRVEPDPAVDALDVGPLQRGRQAVRVQGAGPLDRVGQDLHAHVAARRAVPLGLDPPALGVGPVKRHGHRRRLGGGVPRVGRRGDPMIHGAAGRLPGARLLDGARDAGDRQGRDLQVAPLPDQDRDLGVVHPDEQDLRARVPGLQQPGRIVLGAGRIDLGAEHVPPLVRQLSGDQIADRPGVGDVLEHDEDPVEPVLLPHAIEQIDGLARKGDRFAGDPEQVPVLRGVFGDPSIVGGRQGPGRQDRDRPVLRQQIHRGQGRLGADRASHDDVGVLLEDQLLDHEQRLGERNARLQVARVHHLEPERASRVAHADTALRVDLLHGQTHPALGGPAVEVPGRQRRTDQDGLGPVPVVGSTAGRGGEQHG